MIVIHLFVGLVFGILSIVYSIDAGHSFLLGLLCYSGLGALGILLSALLTLIPIRPVLELAQVAFGSGLRRDDKAAHSGQQYSAYGSGDFRH